MRCAWFFAAILIILVPSSAQAEEVRIAVPDPATSAERQFIDLLLQNETIRGLGIEIVLQPMSIDEIARGDWVNDHQMAISRLSTALPLSQQRSAYAGLMSYPVLGAHADQQRKLQQSLAGAIVAAEIGNEEMFPLAYFVGEQTSIVAQGDPSSRFWLEGRKVITQNEGSAQLLEALGAEATVWNWANDSPLARLAFDDSIEGIETPFFDELATVVLETKDAYVLSGFRRENGLVLVTTAFWNSISPRVQRGLQEGVELATQWQFESELKSEAMIAAQWTDALGTRAIANGLDSEFVRKSFLTRFGVEEGRRALELLAADKMGLPPKIEPQSYRETDTLAGPHVYFVTDRHPFPNETRLEDRYGGRTAGPLTINCGELILDRSPAGLGQYHGDLLLVGDASVSEGIDDCAAFVTQHSENLVLLVHGFSTNFGDSLRRVLSFARDVDLKSTGFVIWSWPSQGQMGAYDFDEETAAESGRYFSTLVHHLASRLSGDASLIVVSHSMGGRLVDRLLPWQHTYRTNPLFVFVAPDIPSDVFERTVSNAQAPATLYASTWDAALSLSSIINGSTRAGQGGDDLIVLPDLESVDLSDLNDLPFLANHGHALDLPEAFADLERLVVTREPAALRGLERHEKNGRPYYTLPQTPMH